MTSIDSPKNQEIQAQAQQLLQLANDHGRAGRYEEAASCYSKILELMPDASGVHKNLGVVLRESGSLENALQSFKQGLEVSPDSPEIHFEIGKTLLQMDCFDDALIHLEKVLSLKPDSSGAFFLAGVVHRKQERYAEAIRYFQKTLALNSSMSEAYFELGGCLFDLRKYQDAVTCFNLALNLDPDLTDAHFLMAHAFKKCGDFPASISSFTRALELDPQDAVKHFELGNVLHNMGDLRGALESYQKAVQLNSEYISAFYNLGMMHYKLGNRKEALVNYQKSQDISVDDKTIGPWRLRIEPASACNLRCQHCPTGLSYDKTSRSVMTMELFDEIISQIKEIDNLIDCVLYFGGEPLLNKHLAEMCRRLKEETGVKHTGFNTNGMLITEELCAELAGAGINQIQISIDGRNPEENDRIRKGSNYAELKNKINLLRTYCPNTRIGIANTVIKQSEDPEIPVPAEFLVADFPGLPISTEYAMSWPGLETGNSAITHLEKSVRPPKQYCNKPFTEMVVRANGDLLLCCYDLLGEKKMGNIKESKLIDIWNNEEYRALRKAMLENDVGALPDVCRKCMIYSGEIITVEED